MRQLILLGGGHAHLAVLHALARRRPPGWQIRLICPSLRQTYSGMLPGWLAGHYALSQCQIDLAPLLQRAGVEWLPGELQSLDAGQRLLTLRDGQQLGYHLLSLDIGSCSELPGYQDFGAGLLPVRPLSALIDGWQRWLANFDANPRHSRFAVAGGGAAGVELALALNWRLAPHAAVTLFVGQRGLLPDQSPAVVKRAEQALARHAIKLWRQPAQVAGPGLLLQNGLPEAYDLLLLASGGVAPACLAKGGLALDARGFVAVGDTHQSVSHTDVFAAGDCCSRNAPGFARSGVHAVHAGPVLAANLLAAMQGGALSAYIPRRQSLYLLATGPRHAIASWGRWSAQGNWVWRWKDWIDRGFIRKQQA